MSSGARNRAITRIRPHEHPWNGGTGVHSVGVRFAEGGALSITGAIETVQDRSGPTHDRLNADTEIGRRGGKAFGGVDCLTLAARD